MAEEVERKFTPIFFHQETTGFETFDEVIQIQLLSKKFGTLELYIVPTVDPDERATYRNNFQVFEGQLFKDEKLITNTSERMVAWNTFADFVLSHDNPILIFHNISFQGRFLRQEIQGTPVADRLENVHIADSLAMCRKKLPELEKHTFEYLAMYVSKNLDYDSTNSEMKVFLLKYLFKHMQVTRDELNFHTQNLQDYLNGKKKPRRKSPYAPAAPKSKRAKKSLNEREEPL